MSDYERDDYKTFRKRVIGMILATDMARHVADLASFKSLIEQRGIDKSGTNAHLLVDHESPARVFDSQQQILEMIVHSADISTQTRPFDIAREWTYLLFEEFFY